MFDFLKFNWKKEVTENIDINDTKKVIDDVFNSIENIIFKKAESFLENDTYICSFENFKKLSANLKEKWLDIEKNAWLYIISKSIKNENSTSVNILKKFQFNEK